MGKLYRYDSTYKKRAQERVCTFLSGANSDSVRICTTERQMPRLINSDVGYVDDSLGHDPS